MAEFYVVECDGPIAGRRENWIEERDLDKAFFPNIVADIRDGQIRHVKAVYRVDPKEGTSCDVTEDVAQAIAANLQEHPNHELKDFLEHALGCEAVAVIEREFEEWRSDRFEHLTHYAALSGVA